MQSFNLRPWWPQCYFSKFNTFMFEFRQTLIFPTSEPLNALCIFLPSGTFGFIDLLSFNIFQPWNSIHSEKKGPDLFFQINTSLIQKKLGRCWSKMTSASCMSMCIGGILVISVIHQIWVKKIWKLSMCFWYISEMVLYWL